MTDEELVHLLRDLESDRVERKESAADLDRIRQAICAFANDLPDHRAPGVVFVGTRDDGTCAGLRVDDELLLRLAGLRDDGSIQPFPSMQVERRVLDGCELAVVTVEPDPAPPVRVGGVSWIRVGPRRARATVAEERRLSERRRWAAIPYDAQPVRGASFDELDLSFFRQSYLPKAVAPEVLSGNDRDVADQLKALRFVAPDGTPTVLGVLVLAAEPRRHLPCAYVQFLRIAGHELSDPIRDAKEIGGPLARLLVRLDDVCEAHVQVAVQIEGAPVEVRRPDYPLEAIRQVVRNAALHRTYEGTNAPVRVTWFDDRIEILSPGGPYGLVTRENFGKPGVADYRNPHLAEAMKVLGFVQRFGVGLQIARRVLRDNGSPPLEFEVEATHVVVRLRKRP